MLLSITLKVQLCLPRPPLTKGSFPPALSFSPGEGGLRQVARKWVVQVCCLCFLGDTLRAEVLKVQTQAQHQHCLELVGSAYSQVPPQTH